MSKYDKTVSISHEEEGTYHRREYEQTPPRSSTTKHYNYEPVTTYTSYPVAKTTSTTLATRGGGISSDEDNFEEWTTSKRKINHKTRQVETRVSRQLLVEDGKVIADSGPQVTTRIKEDNKVEECEKEKQPKNKNKFDALESAPEGGECSGRVLGEKKEIQRVSREVREENMQYHDERFKELTGHDVHRRAIQAPHELITITDKDSRSAPRGKMVHYSNKGKQYVDTDEILEVAKLAIDGSITKEVKRTKHHEEFSEDEKPDETGEAEELRHAPKVERSSRRHVDYVNDFDDTDTPSERSDDEIEHHSSHPTSGRQQYQRHRPTSSASTSARRHHTKSGGDDVAFPRYKIDPLLNSLNDDDFRPVTSTPRGHSSSAASGRYKEHSLERKAHADSSDEEQAYRRTSRKQVSAHRQRSPSPLAATSGGPIEIPEEYRVHKGGRSKTSSSVISGRSNRERSFSPARRSKLSAPVRPRSSYKEDASVQAHLTDEEEIHSHERQTKSLQRQATGGSKRNYYFGEKTRRRSPSIKSATSVSSSSLSDPKERMRQQGVRSRDSGFKSPNHHKIERNSEANPQQIYSISKKSGSSLGKNERSGAISPTPTTGSMGQRSVKTTTTTMSAGLADRPLSRNERSISRNSTASKQKDNSKAAAHDLIHSTTRAVPTNYETVTRKPTRSRNYNQRQRRHDDGSQTEEDHSLDTNKRQSLDTISIASSSAPNAKIIRVPFQKLNDERQVIPITGKGSRKTRQHQENVLEITGSDVESVQGTGSEMSLRSDIDNLRKRLESIKQEEQNKKRFDYKTLVAEVPQASQQQVVGAYSVHHIEHNSPFQQQIVSGDGIASSETQKTSNENNNEKNFNLSEYMKRSSQLPVEISIAEWKMKQPEEDRVSLISSNESLRSTRTYNIRTTSTISGAQDQRLHDFDNANPEDNNINDDSKDTTSGIETDGRSNITTSIDNERRPAAWIFDLRDESSTFIAAPPKPKGPEPPKIETEELAQSRGGRSYYLGLIENDKPQGEAIKSTGQRERPSSIDSLYSRWNSQGNLAAARRRDYQSTATGANKSHTLTKSTDRQSRQVSNIPLSSSSNMRPTMKSSTSNGNLALENNPAKRRQLPFGGQLLTNRSKSSSCLLAPSTRSKYSIYGGLKKPNDTNKPVPRLSYSRTIGPKSQRQLDAQPKLPSRYMKVR